MLVRHGCDRKSPGIWSLTVYNVHVMHTRLGRATNGQLHTRAHGKALEIKKEHENRYSTIALHIFYLSFFPQLNPLDIKNLLEVFPRLYVYFNNVTFACSRISDVV